MNQTISIGEPWMWGAFIELLKAFVNVGAYTNEQLAWKVGLHMTFVVSGVPFAVMDRLTRSSGH